MYKTIITASLAVVFLSGCAGTRHLSDVSQDNEHVIVTFSEDGVTSTYQRMLHQGRQCFGDGNVLGDYTPNNGYTKRITVSLNASQPRTNFILSADLKAGHGGTLVKTHYFGRLWVAKAALLSQIASGTLDQC